MKQPARPGSPSNNSRDISERPSASTLGEVSAALEVGDWRGGRLTSVSDRIIEEQAVALVYNGISHVVMMATPDHLEDFALGFSLTEGIIESPSELYDIELSKQDKGVQIAMQISTERFASLKEVRRNMTGRTGCGLCGAESLEQAIREPEPVSGAQQYSHDAIEHAVRYLEPNQPLQAVTGAVHGAAWCDDKGNIELVREDVGRHNALDKLYGALCRDKAYINGEAGHFALISSRASYEMVVKAAAMGVEMLVAVSAPTRLAIDVAQRVNITLVGFARPGRHMVYTHPRRIV